MKLGANGLIVEDFAELETFFYSLNLNGILRFNEDLKDHQDKVLIREDIAIKQTQIDKLKEIRGAYPETFDVKLSAELVHLMVAYLTGAIEQYAEENPLFQRLFEPGGRKGYRFIQTALNHTRTAASAYIIKQKDPAHFRRIAELGVLALGIALQQTVQLPRLHAHAFLAAFFSELPFSNAAIMLDACDDPVRLREVSEKAAMFASRLDAHSVVVDCIRQTPSFSELSGEMEHSGPPTATDRDLNVMENILFFEGEQSSGGDQGSKDEERALPLLIDILKFARYILYLFRRLEGSASMVEEISYRAAYNAKKGFFNMAIAQTVLKVFKEYEIEYRSLMRVAEIERRCLFPPSAWAYPKPRSTQIICMNHVLDCPNLKSGWDLHVVSPQEAFGWIGANLDAGKYNKCKLEDELNRIGTTG